MLWTLALVALQVAAPQDKDKEKDKQEKPAEETHTVQKGALVPKLEIDATFEPSDSAEVRLKPEAWQGEMVLLKAAAHGEIVKKGDALLTFDRVPIEKQIAVAENELRVARAGVDKAAAELDAGAKADALALAQAQTQLKSAEDGLKNFDEVNGKQMLQMNELMVKFREDGVKDQEEELKQLEEMYKSEELTNATAEIVVRRSRRALDRTRTFLEMAREDARVIKEYSHPEARQSQVYQVENAKRALESLRIQQAHGRVTREAEHARSKAGLAQQEEAMAKLKRDLEGFTLRATLDGRVFYGPFQQGQWGQVEQMSVMIRPGEKIPSGQVLMTVCGPTGRARVDLPEASYLDVAPGQAVILAPAALPGGKIEGTVRAKGIVTLPRGAGPSFDLRVDLKEPHADLLPGMKGRATITGPELKDVVVVPSTAVTVAGPKATVTVVKNAVHESREVVAGRTDGKMTEIRSGLEPGEKILPGK